MDPSECWNAMLIAYATKQWQEAGEYAESLLHWLESDGFAPQPTIGTTTMEFTCQLDDGFCRAICSSACRHVIDRAGQEVADATR